MSAIVRATCLLLVAGSTGANAHDHQEHPPKRASQDQRGQVYGFAQGDLGYNFGTINSDWSDLMRPTQLPDSQAQLDGRGQDGADFPPEGTVFAGVRHSRFGIQGWFPTDLGELYTIFEIDFLGEGADAGETTIRLRHAYGQLGQFGAGQTWTPFMDIDAIPNILEQWGPNGMPFTRTVQVRWMPLQGQRQLTFALERPGGSRDPANADLEDFIDNNTDLRPRFPVPDVAAAYQQGLGWGYLRGAALYRRMEWEDENPVDGDQSGAANAWGFSLSGNAKLGPHGSVLRFQLTYGEGIEGYINDAGGDIGVHVGNDGIDGKAIPVLGTLLFYDLAWNARWTSSIGFSTVNKWNTNGEADDAFDNGQYAIVNLLHHPVPAVMLGGELQYGRRENYSDGWSYDAFKFQFSARYKFSLGIP